MSNQNNVTLEHKSKLSGLSVAESWIVEDEKKDKSALYNFNVPTGTWMISMKVDNDEVWSKVKSGEIKGFSIEGYFTESVNMKKITSKDPGKQKSGEEILQELRKYIAEYEEANKKATNKEK